MLGTQILNYRIVSLIGEGGMGNVYLAEHATLGRKAAIKVLSPQYANNPEIRARFKNEASTLSKLHHPNIVTLYDYVEDDDRLCLVMEYVDGHNLDHYIANIRGPIPESVALPLFDQILSAFAYAHNMGVIHRDIKPSNIIITPENKVKILDFGIAKLLEHHDHKLTRTGARMGTVLYMSPELVQGKVVDLRSDIYSLGVTLFQMLSGHEPYDKTLPEFEVYNNIVHNPLPRVKEFYPMISNHVQDIIDKATRKNPDDRFQNCDQFLAALHPTKITKPGIDIVDEADPVPPSKIDFDNKPKKKRQRRPRSVRILSLLLILSVLGGGYWLYYWYTHSANASYYVVPETLYLRSTKDDKSQNIIDTLKYGEEVKVVEKDGLSGQDGLLWCKIRPINSKNEGYVAYNYLSVKGEFERLRLIFTNEAAQQKTKVAFKKALYQYFMDNGLFIKETNDNETHFITDWGFDEKVTKVADNIIASPDLNGDAKEDYACILKNKQSAEKWLFAFISDGPDEARNIVANKLPKGNYRVKKAAKKNAYYLGKTTTDSLGVKLETKELITNDGFLFYDYNANKTWLYLWDDKQQAAKRIAQ